MKVEASRAHCLDKAKEYVTVDRNGSYGEPEDNFRNIANLWNAHLAASNPSELTSTDVAIMLTLLKIARVSTNPEKYDSWVDICGYAACGAEIACSEKSAPSEHKMPTYMPPLSDYQFMAREYVK